MTMADFIKQKLVVVVLCLFVIFISKTECSNCGFAGQCMYNIDVHHCSNSTRTVRTPIVPKDCSCSQLGKINKNFQDIHNTVIELNRTFQVVRSDLRGVKQELKEEESNLDNVIIQNNKNNLTLQKQLIEIKKTEQLLTIARNDWLKEKARLQKELQSITHQSQRCKTPSSTATTSGPSSSSSVSPGFFCDFESSSLCSFVQDKSDNLDWLRGHSTVQSSTGPKQDHTFGNPHGHYMYLDAYNHATTHSHSYSPPLPSARLESQVFPPSSAYCVFFWYSMHGRDVKDLNVYAKVHGGLGNPVFTHKGEIDQEWHLGKISLDSEYTSSQFHLVFEASTGSYKSYRYNSGYTYHERYGNIAIDDIYVYNTSCSSINKYPANVHMHTSGNKTSYYTFHATPATWYEAQTLCKKEIPYSHLVSIQTAEEQRYLVKMIKLSDELTLLGNSGFYTSGTDDRSEGIFEWTDTGTPYPLPYSNWKTGQPNNVGSNQDCLLLQYPDQDWTWGDVNCDEKHPFICEINHTI